METVVNVVAALLLAVGALVAVTGGIGVLRMPDFYTRAHCAGKGDTLAQLLILVGLAVYAVWHFGVSNLAVFKLAFIVAFILFTAPTATHAVARGARLDGLEPWKTGEPRR